MLLLLTDYMIGFYEKSVIMFIVKYIGNKEHFIKSKFFNNFLCALQRFLYLAIFSITKLLYAIRYLHL